MATRSLLSVLKDELAFFEAGGYGKTHRSTWRPTLLLRDSPACLNFDFTTAKPCRDCILFPLVPEDKRNSLLPCHQIPLNAAGETIASLYEKASQEKLDEKFRDWLCATIQKFEKREVSPMEATLESVKTLESSTAISFKNILFLTDFSPASEAAFTYAVAFARHFGARVYPAHAVVPPLVTEAEAPVAMQLLKQNEEDRFTQLNGLFKGTGVSYQPLISQAMLENIVPVWIREHGIDLIIVGTHGRKGVDRFFLGSTAEMIFRTATCPVLTVGPYVPLRFSNKLEIKKVLCALALSKETEPGIPYALSFAQESHAALTFLHVIDNDIQTVPEPDLLAGYSTTIMKGLVPESANLDYKPEFVVQEGVAADEIINFAEQAHTDLVVLGISNKKKLSTHFRRGVAYKVISSVPCAVLTVR